MRYRSDDAPPGDLVVRRCGIKATLTTKRPSILIRERRHRWQPTKPRPRIAIGLQGGGAHGAFTWGTLDRLLEEPWLQVDGISETSAGAMNAAVLVDGHAKGGADRGAFRAREFLAQRLARGFAEPTA